MNASLDPAHMESDRLRQRMEEVMASRGLNPAEWARLAGLPTANSLYNFWSGRQKSFSVKTLKKLADALGMTVADFIQGNDMSAFPISVAKGQPSPERRYVNRPSSDVELDWTLFAELVNKAGDQAEHVVVTARLEVAERGRFRPSAGGDAGEMAEAWDAANAVLMRAINRLSETIEALGAQSDALIRAAIAADPKARLTRPGL